MFEVLKLALRRGRSSEDYRAMQEHIARRVADELTDHGVDLANADVLELGAGCGGYSKILHRRAGSFVANDLNPDPFFATNEIPFAPFDVTQPFPLESASFDLVYCSSVIEHVADPAQLLRECRRILRPAGQLYLSFPPFYSLAMVGGHGLQPFHFFGERLALWVHNRKHGSNVKNYATICGNWGLYPLTIAKVAQYLAECGFRVSETYTRLSPINTAKLPGFLKDLATWHVCYLARPEP